MKDKEKLLDEAFKISEHIRYIAAYDVDGLAMKQRGPLAAYVPCRCYEHCSQAPSHFLQRS